MKNKKSEKNPSKVIVIGLDGATFDIIDPLIAKGRLPNLQSIIERGVRGNLESTICKLRASSGSDITVKVSNELYAKASSGADIRYYGNPDIRDIDESSGGDVTQK